MKKARRFLLLILTLSLLIVGHTSAQTDVPQIRSIDPDRAGVGQRVTIKGRNFSSEEGENRVLFGEREAIVIKAKRKKLIVVVPNALPTGRVSVTVQVAGQTSNPVQFDVVIPTVPIEGDYKGQTSQGTRFDFTVQENQVAVTEFRTTFTCTGVGCTAGATVSIDQFAFITNGRFDLTVTGTNVRVIIEGAFVSATEARGTVEFETLRTCICQTGRLTWTAELD